MQLKTPYQPRVFRTGSLQCIYLMEAGLIITIDLEQIRSANPIEQIVGEKFTLKRQGTRFVGVEHDSLVVTPQTGLYFWNSCGEYGDAFDFAGRHLLGYDNRWNNRDAAMFWEAVRSLAQRAGID